MYSVSKLKDSVSAILSGLNLSNVSDLNGALERAARSLVQKADIVEASGRQVINVYDHVYDTLAPATIFGGCVFDMRPQAMDRNDWDYTYKEYIDEFDRTKLTLPNGVQLTFEANKGVGIMRVASARATARAVLDPMTDTTGWTAAGSASGLVIDSIDYYEPSSSLRFTLTGASTGSLTKTIAAGDMTPYNGVGVIFLALKIPSSASAATLLSQVVVKLGSSSTAYTSVTSTTGYLGAWTVGEWLLVALDLATGANTGSPLYTNITYLQVSLTTTATITNFRVGGIWASLATPYTLLFGSSAIFLPTTGANLGTPQLTITDDTDNILLNPAAYTLYQWECAKEVALQQGGKLSSATVISIDKRLDGELYPMYRADNPSNEIRITSNYYDD